MKRVLWSLAALTVFELAVFGAGWKYCGDPGWGIAFMFAGPIMLWPWMIAAAAIAFFVRGIGTVDRFLTKRGMAALTFFGACLLAPAIAYAATYAHAEGGCQISW